MSTFIEEMNINVASQVSLLYILTQTMMSVMAVSSESALTILRLICKRYSSECPDELKCYDSFIQVLISFDRPDVVVQELARKQDIKIIFWKDILIDASSK